MENMSAADLKLSHVMQKEVFRSKVIFMLRKK